jgi:predicted small secreted protein
MKKTMTLILVLMFALGCLSSCENTPNEVSQDVSAESLVSDF